MRSRTIWISASLLLMLALVVTGCTAPSRTQRPRGRPCRRSCVR